ncbi:MAG: alpha/beta fold hydrolase [Flavobacteriaceae bacterium]|nr:alpha/beta fold hydrolase [Flavobacteriaceae bacterium]
MILHSQIIGEGKPFIILHGFLGMGDNWKTLGKKFSELGYQVHLVDQRNHGRSFHHTDFSYEIMANDLNEYLIHHNLNEVVLLGHSMGGKTAMYFATTYPDKVKQLIVADIAPKEYPSHHQDILKALHSLDFAEINKRSEADEVLSVYIKEWGTRQFLLKNLYWKEKGLLDLRMNLEVLSEKIDEIGKALPQDKTYHGETLFLGGQNSNYIDSIDALSIPMHFPKAKIETVSEAGHWLHADNPTEFFEKVTNFLKSS